MATVRIAHAEPRPGKLANGGFATRGYLVVLADDAGRRAVPIWLRGEPGESDLSQLVELAGRPAGEIIAPDVPEELTARMLLAAGATVTGVDIDVTTADIGELTPQVTVARISLEGPGGSRQVTAGLGLGLAMAAAATVPVRVADAVMDRLATPVAGDDLLTPFAGRVPPVARAVPGYGPPGWPMGTLPGRRPRYEPRNLDFAAGLDRWDLDCGYRRAETQPPAAAGYSAAAEGERAILSSVGDRPSGAASLVQAVFAEDYRGRTVVFSGEIRTAPLTGQAGLRLEIFPHWWRAGLRQDHGVTLSGGHREWTRHQVTAPVPEDADIIRFGITLTGPGQIELRHPGLRIADGG